MRLRLPVPLRWADLDAYGHVNNVEMLRVLEEARIAAFWRHEADAPTWPTAVLDAGPTAATHTFVAAMEIEYLAPLGYHRDPVTVEMWIGNLGGASIDVCYEVTRGDAAARTVFARARTTIVLVDAATGRPRRITAQERAAWEPYLGEPVALRRRR
ncbi:thioesterase family protein [Isoptericola sp. b441]|uniref:Thioesterase family protein n=1 Tax=Actinotalea lenta TaxID=3064654 RepID=A0ABT9D8L4_9CELL|nr:MULTISPECIES: thioesterase family protein [unclassified Isoptericola]MDO8107234.1 thioesterase family protein [Isoptericola sp. b441]MDO8121103.1 thioesterase family protein [Isoptericola sp. b490]